MAIKIERVEPGSEAEALGLAPGDELLAVDENELNDSLDYDFYTDSSSFHLKAKVADGIREWNVQRILISFSLHISSCIPFTCAKQPLRSFTSLAVDYFITLKSLDILSYSAVFVNPAVFLFPFFQLFFRNIQTNFFFSLVYFILYHSIET